METKFKIAQFENKTLSWWYNRKNKIDMNPPYQRRGHLWSDTDKAYLIDSILNGYDIPKIYLADFTWGDSKLNKKKLPYAIIDGKQRFEAIFGFFDGTVVLNDDFAYLENPQYKLGGLGYKDIQNRYKDIAETFSNYNLMVMSVIASDEEQINELFIRLNRSKPLTGAEVRNAMTGPAPKLFRQIANHEFFTTNIKFDVKRGNDLNLAAKILLFEYYKDFQDTTKKNLDKFVEDTEEGPKYKLELSGRYVLDTLTDMSNIFLPKDKLLTSAGIIPVYYWLVRDIPEKKHSSLRKYLVQFEKQRRINIQLIKSEPNRRNIKLFLIEYNDFNRSTNSVQSHRGRFRILKENFMKWEKAGEDFNKI